MLQNVKDLVSYLAERVSFLREFVESRDYPLLSEFLGQSSAIDTHKDFARYLKAKRACDEEKAREVEKRLEKRRTLKLVRAMGEVVGFLLMASGMLSVCFAVYARHNALTMAGLPFGMGVSDMLIAGFVVFSLGFVVTTSAWVSAKGAASAVSKLKSVCTLSKGEGMGSAPATDVEYHLQIPGGVDINSVGFVGMCDMTDFKALVDELKIGMSQGSGAEAHHSRSKKKASLTHVGSKLKELTGSDSSKDSNASVACGDGQDPGSSKLALHKRIENAAKSYKRVISR